MHFLSLVFLCHHPFINMQFIGNSTETWPAFIMTTPKYNVYQIFTRMVNLEFSTDSITRILK